MRAVLGDADSASWHHLSPGAERRRKTLLKQAEKLVASTGYEEILASLSTSDYGEIQGLIQDLG